MHGCLSPDSRIKTKILFDYRPSSVDRYTPTRDDQPMDPLGGSTAVTPRGRNRQRPRAVSAGRLAKEHEMLQNMWLESHGHRQQQQRTPRRSSSLGNSRTVYIKDRATGTVYRRGRLLGKVRGSVLLYTVAQSVTLQFVLNMTAQVLRIEASFDVFSSGGFREEG